MNTKNFRCPSCLGVLLYREANFTCNFCERVFGFVDGVPDFFIGDLERDFADDPNRTWLDPEIAAVRDTVYRLCARELVGMAYCMEQIRQRTHPGCRILEVGMGTGHFTRWLAQIVEIGTEILAFDYSWPIIDKAKANTQGFESITLLRANARGPLPFREGFFDIVFIRLAPLGEKGMPKIQAAHRLLKPGGWYFDAGWEKTVYDTPPTEWALQHGYDHAERHVWQYYRAQTPVEREAWRTELDCLGAMGCESALKAREDFILGADGLVRKLTTENLVIAHKPSEGQ